MSDASTSGDDSGPASVGRRTILKGAAWSVPAVMVAQLPAFGATGTPPEVYINFGESTACKIPGDSWNNPNYPRICYKWGYVLWAAVVNLNAGTTIYIEGAQDFLIGGSPQCTVAITEPAATCMTARGDLPGGNGVDIAIPPNSTRIVGIFTNANQDSASTNLSVRLWYRFGDGVREISIPQTGSLTGGSWSGPAGQGSCRFPPLSAGCAKTPPPACNTNCDYGD
jgi:hypothetical protein